MFVGRLLGWGLLALALLMASADAVLALGPVDCPSIATGEVVTLLTGAVPDSAQTLGGALLRLPVWVVAGIAGTGLCAACRRRSRRHWFRR